VATGNASEAYRRAYNTYGSPETVAREAHALVTHPKVAPRIEELREQIAAYANLTPEAIAAEFTENRQHARDWHQACAMNTATERKADLLDLFHKRQLDIRQLSVTAELSAISVEELRELVGKLEAHRHPVLESPESSVE
jgi:DNA-binding transcriptional regulator YiaG